MAFACNEASENFGKYFPINATGHVTEKLTLIFSTFEWLFVALAYKYTSRFTRFNVTHVLSFPDANNKSVLQSSIKNINKNKQTNQYKKKKTNKQKQKQKQNKNNNKKG